MRKFIKFGQLKVDKFLKYFLSLIWIKNRYQAQWVSLISTALFLEDVEKAINEKRLPSSWAKTAASVKNSEQSVNQIILFLRSQFAVFNAHPVVMAFKYHWYVHIWSPFFKVCFKCWQFSFYLPGSSARLLHD